MQKKVWFIVDEAMNPMECVSNELYPFSPMFFDELSAVACMPSNGNYKVVYKWINFIKE